MDHSFELEELEATPIVPALHCGPGHCHMGYSFGADAEEDEPTEES